MVQVVTLSSPAWLCWVLEFPCCCPIRIKKFPTTCANNLFDDTVEWTMFWQQGWGNYRPFPPSWCLTLPLVCWGRSWAHPWDLGRQELIHGQRWMELCQRSCGGQSFSCQFVNMGVRQCRTFWIMRHNLFVVWTDRQKNCCHSISVQREK